MSEYPVLQWSCFSKDKLEQVVVRAETTEQADQLITWAKTKLSQPSFPNDSGPSVTPPDKGITPAPICGNHHTPMTLRPGGVSQRTGRPYPPFWSCGEQGINGQYCDYKPPKNK